MSINNSDVAFVKHHLTQQSSLLDFWPQLFSCLLIFLGEILHESKALFFLLTNCMMTWQLHPSSLLQTRWTESTTSSISSFHCGKILRRCSSIFLPIFSPSSSSRLESLKFQCRLYLSTSSIFSFNSAFPFLRSECSFSITSILDLHAVISTEFSSTCCKNAGEHVRAFFKLFTKVLHLVIQASYGG